MLNLLTILNLKFADAATAVAPPSFGEMMARTLPMFAMVFFIFYFLVLRPQVSKDRAHRALISTLKRGDNVVTSSGLIAKVASIESDHVVLDAGSNVRMRFEPQHIVRRYESKINVEQQQASHG